MLHQTFLFLGQLWQLFEVSQILEFLRYLYLHIIQYIYMYSKTTCTVECMVIFENKSEK